MKFHTACLSILLLAIVSAAQAPMERQILVTPNAEHPQAAKDSGLGGRVRVAVTVDQAGTVVAVAEPTGPGDVCQSVTRADVVALRESAKAAAADAKFAPSADPNMSIVFLNFEFPRSGSEPNVFTFGTRAHTDDQRRTKLESAEFTASNPPPPDYTGPVYTASNRSPAGSASSANPTGGERVTIKGDDRSTVRADDKKVADKKAYDVYGDSTRSGTRSVPENAASGVPPSVSTNKIPQQVSGGVLNGKAVSLPKPPYPAAARAVRAAGAVSIQVLVDEQGQIFSASAVSGHPLLRAAARNAACEAVFSPVYLGGNPVKVSGVITYNFVP